MVASHQKVPCSTDGFLILNQVMERKLLSGKSTRKRTGFSWRLVDPEAYPQRLGMDLVSVPTTAPFMIYSHFRVR
jgi:hypothetical protein